MIKNDHQRMQPIVVLHIKKKNDKVLNDHRGIRMAIPR